MSPRVPMRTMILILVQVAVVTLAWGQIRHGDRIVTVVGHASPNIRSAPRTSSETLLGTIPRGTQMKLLVKEGAWFKVLHPDGRTAYLHERYGEPGVARDLVEVTASNANVRRNASTGSSKVGRVKRGAMLPLIRERNNWFLVMLPEGGQGWLRNDLAALRPLAPPPKPPASRSPEEPPAEEPTAKEEPPSGVEAEVDAFRQGREFVTIGKTEQAIAAFRSAIKSDPNRSEAHFELAMLLKEAGDTEGAVKHFREAMRGTRPLPEARFYMEELLQSPSDSSAVGMTADDEAVAASWMSELLEGSTYVLPALGLGSLLFLIVLGVIYKRRRANQTGQPIYRRRKPDSGFDSVLKYAVEKRPLLRAIEEAERKRAEMDQSLRQQLETFKKEVKEGGPQLPGGESAESLLKRLDGLRQTILNQEERAKIYAELVVLQNEKIKALEEEIEALKKLIELDYQDSRKQAKKAKPKP